MKRYLSQDKASNLSLVSSAQHTWNTADGVPHLAYTPCATSIPFSPLTLLDPDLLSLQEV